MRDVSVKRRQSIFRQFINLIKHTMQWYSRWHTSNHILSEEKKAKTKTKTKTKSEQKLINTNAITTHNAIAISSDQKSWRASLNLIQAWLQLLNKCLWHKNLKSLCQNQRIELRKEELTLIILYWIGTVVLI